MSVEVTKELLLRVAQNARLRLTDEEVERFLPQIKEIIVDSFNRLDEIDTTGVKPSFQPIELQNRFRKDEVKNGLTQEEALLNVVMKLKQDGYIKGPKAL